MPSYWYAMHRVYPKSCIMDHDSDNYSPRQHTRYSIRWLMWKRVRPGCGTLPLPTPRLPIIFPSLKFSIKVRKLSLSFALDPVLSCLPRSLGELDVVLLLDYYRCQRPPKSI